MTPSLAAEGWQLDATALPPVPRTYVQQNFTSLYAIDTEGAPGNDLAFRLHANGLCVVTLAPSHAALASRDVQAAAAGLAATPGQQGAASSAGGSEAQADQQTAAAAAAAVPTAPRSAEARLTFSAKLLQAEFRKGRGPLLHADTILGRLTAGGREFVLRCGVRGLLVELNPRLPDLRGAPLLRELQRGYLAILDVRAAEAGVLAARCLSEQAYQGRVQERTAGQQAAGQQQQQQQQQQPQSAAQHDTEPPQAAPQLEQAQRQLEEQVERCTADGQPVQGSNGEQGP